MDDREQRLFAVADPAPETLKETVPLGVQITAIVSHKKRIKIYLKNVSLLVLILLFSTDLLAQTTETIFLSGKDAATTVDWDFFSTDGRNSGKWSTIPVPSNWELQGFGTYNYGRDYKKDDIEVSSEHGLYKHEFQIPASWKDKTVNIVFDGSMTDTKVKINGKSAGEMHQGAFYRFK